VKELALLKIIVPE
jgi:hypothetical protein